MRETDRQTSTEGKKQRKIGDRDEGIKKDKRERERDIERNKESETGRQTGKKGWKGTKKERKKEKRHRKMEESTNTEVRRKGKGTEESSMIIIKIYMREGETELDETFVSLRKNKKKHSHAYKTNKRKDRLDVPEQETGGGGGGGGYQFLSYVLSPPVLYISEYE